jgi:hypothetical protein
MDAIEQYIDTKLDQGFTLSQIANIFKRGILPNDVGPLIEIIPEDELRITVQQEISRRLIAAFDKPVLE